MQGLNDFIGEHPPVAPVFYGFRIMVGVGLLMILVSWLGLWQWKRKKPWSGWYLKTLVGMTFSGWLATLAGWYVTEIGRQPYLVSGVLTTAEAVTDVPPLYAGISLTLYAVVYSVLLIVFIASLFRMAKNSVSIEEYETRTVQPTESLRSAMPQQQGAV